jgi:hypothetical protein
MREARLERSGSRITQTKTFAGPISMKKKNPGMVAHTYHTSNGGKFKIGQPAQNNRSKKGQNHRCVASVKL